MQGHNRPEEPRSENHKMVSPGHYITSISFVLHIYLCVNSLIVLHTHKQAQPAQVHQSNANFTNEHTVDIALHEGAHVCLVVCYMDTHQKRLHSMEHYDGVHIFCSFNDSSIHIQVQLHEYTH